MIWQPRTVYEYTENKRHDIQYYQNLFDMMKPELHSAVLCGAFGRAVWREQSMWACIRPVHAEEQVFGQYRRWIFMNRRPMSINMRLQR